MSSSNEETALLSAIREYLLHRNLTDAAEALGIDCAKAGLPMVDDTIEPRFTSTPEALQIADTLTNHLEHGEYAKFFEAWAQQIPAVLRTSDAASKLDFYLNIYFAIFPLSGADTPDTPTAAMQRFKVYLESGGAVLAKTTEFLSYYALPFVDDPQNHPSFGALFNPNWGLGLKQKLAAFLGKALSSSNTPDLAAAWRSHQSGLDTTLEPDATTVNTAAQQERDELQGMLSECEEFEMHLIRQHNSLQKNYHSLLGTAAELVEALETCVKGGEIEASFLARVVNSLGSFINVGESQIEMMPKIGPMAAKAREHGSLNNSLNTSRGHLAANMETAPLPELDDQKIRRDLTKLTDRNVVYLLQALRWRVTRSRSGIQRALALDAFINADLLGLSDANGALYTLLKSNNGEVREYTTRLLNCLSSLARGRAYLLRREVLVAMQGQLEAEVDDSMIRQNILGALQKLSLRRQAQNVMIEEGIITWLVDTLSRHEDLCEYSVEYSVALLMNLCLRDAGKQYCVSNCPKVLNVLSDLLSHENEQVLTYIHGALYSLLADETLRDNANAMGLESAIQHRIDASPPDMVQQLEYIIQQIHSREPAREPPTMPTASRSDQRQKMTADDEENDDEEPDIDTQDDDDDLTACDASEGESIDAVGASTAVGEVLLCRQYLKRGGVGNGSLSPIKDVSRAPSAARGTSTASRQSQTPTNRLKTGELPLRPVTPMARPISGRTRSRAGDSAHSSRSRPVSSRSVVESRNGSRPSTREMASSRGRSRASGVKSETPVPPTASNPPPPSSKTMEALAKSGVSANIDEYNTTFATRPKVPRTPANH